MAGLPPVPTNVANLKQSFEVGGLTTSSSWWITNDSLGSADGAWASLFVNDWFTFCLPNLLGMQHSEVIPTLFRITTPGFVFDNFAPPAHGSWTGATEQAVATGLKWTTRERGRLAWSATYLPGTPSAFVDGHWQLNETGLNTVRDQALLFMQAVNRLTGPDGSLCELGTLRRKTGAGPLPASLFVGYTDVFSMSKLCTVGRRIPSRRGVLPV